MNRRVVFEQTTVPEYREGFFELLAARLEARLEVLAGQVDFQETVRTRARLQFGLIVPNVFLFGRRLLWQRRSTRRLLRADVAVMTLNPRVLNVWLVSVVRRILGKPTVIWGHAWPRSGRFSPSDRIRNLQRMLATELVVYTQLQVRELNERMPGVRVSAAPNALLRRSEMGAPVGAEKATDFVYVGRLVPQKKPLLLARAFERALDRLPADIRLVVVGDGPLRPEVTEIAESPALDGRLVLTGSVTEVARLRTIYATAIASVSPGYVGLSLTQSLGFGVPMIYARDEPHSPEIEASRPGENAIVVESDSVASLAEALINVAADRDRWYTRRGKIASTCADEYSLEQMVEAIASVIERHLPETATRRELRS